MIYVLSDIHGHMRRFRSVMKQINLQPEDTLYVLGDVIDRNPDGIRILRELMTMPNVKMLLGNHELMMLDALYYEFDQYEQEQRLRRWYHNGGVVTHRYLKHIRKSIRQEIFQFLDKLPVNAELTVNGHRYILTHAAPAADYPKNGYKYDDERQFCVWERYEAWDSCSEDYTVIFGHTPTRFYQRTCPAEIWHGNGLIGIDCACGYYGKGNRLACLRLDDMKEYYSEEDDG